MPQRPTFSADTNTAAPGTIEQETGFSIDVGDRFFTPTTMRYGSGPNTEVFLGWSPFNYVSNPTDPSEIGIGDFIIGTRHRWLDETEHNLAWAVQSSVKLPTASDTKGIGTGELDVQFAAIHSQTIGEASLTGYYELSFLGNTGSGVDLGFGAALAGGLPLSEQISGFAEAAVTLVPEQSDTQLFTTVGMTYLYAPNLVFDVAFLLGLEDAPDFGILVGLTQNIGRPAF